MILKTEKYLRRQSQPAISDFVNININSIQFKLLTICSDDTTAHDFYYGTYLNPTLIKWGEWCKRKGTFIDIGAHTGVYSLTCLLANSKNNLISIEPLPINYFRILSNIRLNGVGLLQRCAIFNIAVSDQNKIINFSNPTQYDITYLSKGGKIASQGIDMKAISIDSLKFGNEDTKIHGIKIDTEGEDYSVLLGGERLIRKYMPKIIVEARKENYINIINLLKKFGYKNLYTINKENTPINEMDINFNGLNVIDIFAEEK